MAFAEAFKSHLSIDIDVGIKCRALYCPHLLVCSPDLGSLPLGVLFGLLQRVLDRLLLGLLGLSGGLGGGLYSLLFGLVLRLCFPFS